MDDGRAGAIEPLLRGALAALHACAVAPAAAERLAAATRLAHAAGAVGVPRARVHLHLHQLQHTQRRKVYMYVPPVHAATAAPRKFG